MIESELTRHRLPNARRIMLDRLKSFLKEPSVEKEPEQFKFSDLDSPLAPYLREPQKI